MSSQRRIIRLLLTTTALLLTGLSLFKIIPSRADYTGPDRTIITYSWQRRVCRYQAVYDPEGPGWYGCSLTLYEPPESSCPATGSVGEYFNPTACPGWPGSCTALPCDISLSSSVDGCSEGDPGCRSVSHTTTLPEATVSGTIACDSPGSNGWCRGAAVLNLSSSEPLDGYSILALEGTHNGATFACSGDACQLSLAEGVNNFTFWAVSSYGDTSNMGSASANLDTQPPIISGQITGTAGQNGWYVSAVSVDTSTSDSGSGLSVLEFSINGASWSAWSGTLSLGDGVHSLALQATDIAGNSSSETLILSVDTQLPELVLNSAASFCPNCGELLEIQIQTADALSGVNDWELRTGATIITSGVTAVDQTFSWDGAGLPAGSHILVLQVHDTAGNSSSTTHEVTLVLPAIVPPRRSAATATPRPRVISYTPTPSGTSTPTYAAESVFAFSLPTPTRIALSIPFGGRPSIPVTGLEGNAPGALPGQDPQSGTNAGTTTTNPVLWGGTAAALVAAAMAVGAAERRRRKAKAQRLAQEMARRNSAAEARERAQAQAEAQARREHAAVEAEKAAQWKSRAEAFRQDEELIENLKMEHRMGSTPSGADLPTAAHAPAGNFRHVTEYQPAPAAAQPRSWWQRTWEGVKSIFTSTRNQQTLTSTGTPGATPGPQSVVHTPNRIATPSQPGFHIPGVTPISTSSGQEPRPVARQARPRPPTFWHKGIDWIDRHQQVIAVGVGISLGVVAIVLSAGALTPLVAIAGSTIVAAGVVAGGTVLLNNHYGRSWTTNLGRNTLLAGGSALLVSSAGILTSSGIVQQGLYRVGNAITGLCASNPDRCHRIATGLELWDHAEAFGLQIKLSIQIASGNPRASETALELQLELMDGTPGNTTFREVFEQATSLLRKRTDRAAQIATILGRVADIQTSPDGFVRFGPDVAAETIEEIAEEIRLIDGRNAWVFGNTMYINSSNSAALEAVAKWKLAIDKGDDRKIKDLLEDIIAATSRGSGDRVVLGAWNANGGYIGRGVESGGAFYDTGREVWDLMELTGIDTWEANEAYLHEYHKRGFSFEFSSRDMKVEDWKNEVKAIQALQRGNMSAALDAMKLTSQKDFSYRLQEVQWLFKNGYRFDEVGDKLIFSIK